MNHTEIFNRKIFIYGFCFDGKKLYIFFNAADAILNAWDTTCDAMNGAEIYEYMLLCSGCKVYFLYFYRLIYLTLVFIVKYY